jgi:integrase
VLKVLSPIWTEKPETARRVRQRIGLVLDWARAAGHRSGDNPVQLLGDALPKHKAKDEHHAALPYVQVPAFIARLRAGPAAPISKLAFEFVILTAARSKEVRGARWHEIDLEAATWTIPGDDGNGRRMKAGREHVVPLAPRALQILVEARKSETANDLIFPDQSTGRMMSENRFLVVRDGLGYSKDQCTPHGFRSSFRDWAAEETSFPSEVAEMALAHTIKSKVEAAYRRGQLLAKRRELMEAWAAYVTRPATCG